MNIENIIPNTSNLCEQCSLIRIADSDDIQNILELHNNLIFEYMNTRNKILVEYWIDRLKNKNNFECVVAYSNSGHLLGFSNTDIHTGQIENFFVYDPTRNIDMMKKLLAFVVMNFISDNKTSVSMWILSSNRRMRYFCQSTGAIELEKKDSNIYTRYIWRDLISILKYI